jgi:hypothetical protein
MCVTQNVINDWIHLQVSTFVLRREGLDVNRIVKLGDMIGVLHPWRRNTRVSEDSWWDRFDQRIVFRGGWEYGVLANKARR